MLVKKLLLIVLKRLEDEEEDIIPFSQLRERSRDKETRIVC